MSERKPPQSSLLSWPLAAMTRRRRIKRLAELKALARATNALYASDEPFTPYRTVNKLQRAMPTDCPWLLRLLVPARLHVAAGLRTMQAVLASAQSQLVREAIVAWHAPRHRAALPVPPRLWAAWPGGSAAVDRQKSLFFFALFLATSWLSGLRRFWQLASYMRTTSALPNPPYIVAMNVGADIVHCAGKGGFLTWLKQGPKAASGPVLAAGTDTIIAVTAQIGSQATTPDWLCLSHEPLPALGYISYGFLLKGWLVLTLAPVMVLFGGWQAAALLADLIELDYARRVDDEKLAHAYLFALGDQGQRPLWSFDVASRGARVVLVFYASSYHLYTHGAKVPNDIINPNLLLNIWDECWFQSEQARDAIVPLLPHTPDCRVVGAFHLVDSCAPMPKLLGRSVAVFDLEPTASPFRLSYVGCILPTETEAEINCFWQKLAEAACALDFVLVHKPKRYNPLKQEWRYRNILALLKTEGRYIQLHHEYGPLRVIRHTDATVISPFTSVGDLIAGSGIQAFYFDVKGTIPEPERYAGGVPVASGPDAMFARLKDIFEVKKRRECQCNDS